MLAAVGAFAVLLLGSVATPARAEGTVVVRSSEAQVNFPRGVSFRLEAESQTEIADVQLQVNTPGQRYGGAIRNVRPSFSPGQRVSATWSWPRFGDQLPPGAEVTYRWRITEADGRVTETPQASVRVQDARHEWRELTEGAITVRWYKGGETFGRDILAAARESTARLQALQGVDLRHPLTVHVYGSQAELYEAVPGAPGWIGGIAIPEFDTVMIGIEPTNLPWGRRALTHEMAHQMVFQMTHHPTLGSRVPTWLNEGLAVVAEGPTELRNRQLIDEAIADDTLPTLRALSSGFSRQSGHLAGVAYAASESAVRYLLDEYGPEKMRALLAGMGEGMSPEQSSLAAYGKTLDRLEDEWRRDLGLRPMDRGQSSNDDQPAESLQAPADGGAGRWLVWLGVGLALLTVSIAGAGGWLVVRRLRA